MVSSIIKALRESVIDPTRETRCKDIWAEDGFLLPSVSSQVNDILYNWIEDLGLSIDVMEMWIVGSLAGYNYRPDTDLDVHVVIDTDEDMNVILDALPNGELVKGTDHPINFYFIKYPETQSLDSSENIYDMLDNKWLKQSDRVDEVLPKDYLLSISKFFITAIDSTISDYELHKKQLEIEDNKQAALLLLQEDYDKLRMASSIVYSFRENAYEGNPFLISVSLPLINDPHYTANEMIYKTLEQYGYKQKLKDSIKECEKLIKEDN